MNFYTFGWVHTCSSTMFHMFLHSSFLCCPKILKINNARKGKLITITGEVITYMLVPLDLLLDLEATTSSYVWMTLALTLHLQEKDPTQMGLLSYLEWLRRLLRGFPRLENSRRFSIIWHIDQLLKHPSIANGTNVRGWLIQ